MISLYKKEKKIEKTIKYKGIQGLKQKKIEPRTNSDWIIFCKKRDKLYFDFEPKLTRAHFYLQYLRN